VQGLATASLSNSQGTANSGQLLAAMAGAPASGYAFYASAPAPAWTATAGTASVTSPGASPKSISAYMGRRHLLAELPLLGGTALPSTDATYKSDVAFAGFLMLALCDIALVLLFAVPYSGAGDVAGVVGGGVSAALPGPGPGAPCIPRPTPRPATAPSGAGQCPPGPIPPRGWCCQNCGSGDLCPAPPSARMHALDPLRHSSEMHSYASGKLAFMMAASAAKAGGGRAVNMEASAI
jgi:hypothetical protein